MGDVSEIKIGEEVLEYISTVTEIKENMINAYSAAESCKQILYEEGTYEGDAKEEMIPFFESLAAHMQKLVMLYQAAEAYLSNTYKTMYYNEEQLVNWISKQFEETNNG